MNSKNHFSLRSKAGLGLCAAFAVTLTGCVAYVDRPVPDTVYVAPVPVFEVVDDYVYYPDYECYYSVSRHQYAYREGSAWIARPAPPNVTVNVLMASPSVRMNFHDSPANHHAVVVKQYPRNWKDKHQDGNNGH